MVSGVLSKSYASSTVRLKFLLQMYEDSQMYDKIYVIYSSADAQCSQYEAAEA